MSAAMCRGPVPRSASWMLGSAFWSSRTPTTSKKPISTQRYKAVFDASCSSRKSGSWQRSRAASLSPVVAWVKSGVSFESSSRSSRPSSLVMSLRWRHSSKASFLSHSCRPLRLAGVFHIWQHGYGSRLRQESTVADCKTSPYKFCTGLQSICAPRRLEEQVRAFAPS